MVDKEDAAAFFEQHGLRVGDRGRRRALRLRRRPAGPEAPPETSQREWIWDSYGVDAIKLGLDLIVAWIPRPATIGRRAGQQDLLAAVRALPGVLEIYDCFDDTVLVLAAAETSSAKRDLQAALRELEPRTLWAEVREVDKEQPARGWLSLAIAIAGSEHRLRP